MGKKRYCVYVFFVILAAGGWNFPLWADSVVVFNEVMYHPHPAEPLGEWIELHNQMAVDVDLSGWSIRGGIDYIFPEGTYLSGGGYLLIAEAPEFLEISTGVTGILGPYEGKLSNSGELLRLENAAGRVMDALEYSDKGDWPVAPDGSGVSLAKKKKHQASAPAGNWTWSEQIGGTPAAENFPIVDLRPREQELVSENDWWRYNIQGIDLGETWRQIAYNDSSWQEGYAGFYYGGNFVNSESQAIPTVFSTGLDESGNPLPVGQMDPHYQFASSGDPVIAMQNHPAWLANDGLSQWVGFSGQGTDNQPAGQFSIVTTFDLSGFDPETAAVTLYLSADNRVDNVLINGVATGITCSDFTNWYGPFVISTGFIEGVNELEFLFTNEGTDWNPAGLRVKMEGTAVASHGRTELASCPVTSYFRKSFVYDKPASSSLELKVEGMVDDGAVFYLNGTEIYRTNMPAGTIHHGDPAVNNLGEPQATGIVTLPADILTDGLNTLAVQVHQAAGGLNDLFFLSRLSVTETSQAPEATMQLALSEITAGTADPFWLEIVNTGSGTVDLSGVVLSLNGDSSMQYVFDSQMLDSNAYLVISESLLGFSPADGDKLFLYAPGQNRVLDAAIVQDVAQARLAAGFGPWYYPQTLSPGLANTVLLNWDIVINEIMYHHGNVYEETAAAVGAVESAEEWIELYNRGTLPVDLSGWKLKGDIDYTFASDTLLAPGEYLVIARDCDTLLTQYPSIVAVGDFSGRLPNSGGTIRLLDAVGNIADEVIYQDGAPWPGDADGYNASLELRNPGANNANPQSWRSSDETAKSEWKTYTYRGIAQPSSVSAPDSQWREFVIGMLDAGRLLLDDISVIEDPDGTRIQLIQNGAFEASPADSKWRLLGTHRHSTVIVDPEDPTNRVLQLVSTGPTDHMHNHLETTLANGRSIVNGREYEISFRAKWLAGSNQLNTRLYFNRLARTTLIEKPQLNGTPGTQNSRYEPNPGPTFSNLLHTPAVPRPDEPVTVSVHAEDPEGVAQVNLFWRLDGQSWTAAPMTHQGQGVYSGSIPPQPAASVVQFYVEAADGSGAVSTFPTDGPDSRALYQVEDGRAATNGLHNLRIVMTQADDTWLHTEINVMSNDRIGATVIYDETEVFYDVGVRLKGSQHHRTPANEVGFNVSFQADHLFRGVHKTVAIDRSQGVGFGQREMLINQAMNRSASVVSKYTDLIKVIPLRIEHTSAAELQLARYNDVYLDSQFEDGSSGNLYEYELIYYPTTTIGGEEDFKRPLPDIPVGAPIVSLGSDKEDYRWLYLAKNNRKADSFERLISFTAAFGDSSSAYYENLADWIDVDQWMSSYAIGVACGAGDNYAGDNSYHNAMFYVRPSDGRVLYFPHDLDHAYDAFRPIVPNNDLNKMIIVPGYERLYYGHLYHFLSTAYNQTEMSHWADHFSQLLPGQNFTAYLSFIDQRSEYLLSQLNTRVAPKYAFEIIDPNSVVDTDSAQVAGKAWIDVRDIYLEGIDAPLDLQWSNQGTGTEKVYFWTATVPLEPGINELVFKAYGFKDEPIGSDTITITSTMQERPLREFLRVTEIMYDPAGGSDYEFIELCNTGPIPLDMTHVVFTEGISFSFAGSPVQTLDPGQYIVIAADPAAFAARYGSSAAVVGQYSGKLSNEGETLVVLGQWNAPVLLLTYSDAHGWPLAAAGTGHSLVPLEGAWAGESPDYGANWRAGTYIGGSPGDADPPPEDVIVFNEVMAVSSDWIELYNTGSMPAAMTGGYWYLSDDADNLTKWQIPETTIAPYGWIVFDNVTGFGLDKAGEQVYLSYLPGTGEDRVVDCVRFEGQEAGISRGRFPDGGAYWQQMHPSPNASNATPAPHIVISEIMYHPLDGKFEYVELYNPTAQAVALWDEQTGSGWRLWDGIEYVFSQGTVIPPMGHFLIVPFAPDETLVSQFVSSYANVPSEIVGPYAKPLSNSGERVTLEKPGQANVFGQPDYWIIVDEVIYFDQTPWPVAADGTGQSLWRNRLTLSGCSPDAWSSAIPSPGTLTCDFNADGVVNLSDWNVIAETWMMSPNGPEMAMSADLMKTEESVIDLLDMMLLMEYWLWESGR